jgi:hypothetical protein
MKFRPLLMVKYLIDFLQKTNLLNNQLRPKIQSFYHEFFKKNGI